MTRHGLLLTAVATVTIPGLLSILAVVGHEHAAGGTDVASVALQGSPLSGPFPEGSTTAPSAARGDNGPVRLGSGTPATELSRVTASQQAQGRHLLDQAAAASLVTSYQGTELVSQSGVGGSVTMISQVWHKGGGPTFVETSDVPAAGTAVASSDPASRSPEGVFGVTKELVAQLGKHYVAVYQGNSSAVGKPASVVEVFRFDGSMAARYWLDRRTVIPLRREVFDTSDKVISEDSFTQVTFGALTLPRFAGQTSSPSRSAWAAATPPANFLAALTQQGWQVPTSLPGGLPLYATASTTSTNGQIVDLEYSDGLYVVSLFVQRGTLASQMPGWHPVSVAGRQAYTSGHSVTWGGLGFVYTVIADAPAQTVTQVVRALPRSGPPGVLDRMERGLSRMASMINPFG